MSVVNVAQRIDEKIRLLERGRQSLRGRAEKKANAIAEYERKMSKTIIQLKNGVPFDVEGEPVVNPAVTNIEKIAKGVCYQEKIDMELAEALYKNAIVGLQVLQAELNALQSIFRHLDEN